MDIEVFVPDIGIDCVEVIEIFVKEGDFIKKEDSLLSVESHKSVLEIPSPVSGLIKKIYIKSGDEICKNKLIFLIDDAVQKDALNQINKDMSDKHSLLNSSSSVSTVCNSRELENNSTVLNDIYASPNIRRIARKLDINLHDVVGSGLKGRITQEDLEKYLKVKNDINFQKNNVDLGKKENKKVFNTHEVHQLLSNVQKISGKNLLNNWKNIPHVTQFDEADITSLEKFRNSYNSRYSIDPNFQKISLLSFLVKSVVYSLMEYPRFNSMLDVSKNNIILKKDINIGIAVDTKIGLLVPVLKDLKYKSIKEISLDIINIVKKAKNNQLNISEMRGGSFTISSLGGIGGTGFTPIINAPEACILGVSKAVIKPVWIKKKFVPRLILPFSLSYDHRIIDGADGVRFTTFLGQVFSEIRILLI